LRRRRVVAMGTRRRSLFSPYLFIFEGPVIVDRFGRRG